MTDAKKLDALNFPLQGSNLIEASAGTGKTYTITSLYVRLILGHKCLREYLPTEILVVTFTEAATKELRDRIRRRLVEAAECFQEGGENDDADEFLSALRGEYEKDEWKSCAQKLYRASEWMDEAAVSTIHAWCGRMLREHAFDSRELFNQKIEEKQKIILEETVRDYWRTFITPMNENDISGFKRVSVYKSPSDLMKAAGELIYYADIINDESVEDKTLIDVLESRFSELSAIKAEWKNNAWADELEGFLDQGKSKGQIKTHPRFYRSWIESLRSWANDPLKTTPDLTDTAWNRFSCEGIKADVKDDAWMTVRIIDVLKKVEELRKYAMQTKAKIRLHAAAWISKRFEEERKRRGLMNFNDLLINFNDALNGNNNLSEIVRAQFPIALVDEFQDTDEIQYGIFNNIYKAKDNREDCAFIMIGDPKQAIYSFRGADIYAYLKARRDCGARLHTLDKNYRSTEKMVKAVNGVFSSAEKNNDGHGAFYFKDLKSGEILLPFEEVTAAGKKKDCFLEVDGENVSAMTFLVWASDNETENKGDANEGIADFFAKEIYSLFEKVNAKKAGIREDEGKLSEFFPSDIAIIVNDRNEADVMRKALSRHGIRAVYLSEQSSVFKSDAAREVLRWLHAFASPNDLSVLRAALCSRYLELPYIFIDKLQNDETKLEKEIKRFRNYYDIWDKQGILPAVRRFLHDYSVPNKLLKKNDERTLTDILHIAELLQSASDALDGKHALMRYMSDMRAEKDSEIDAGDNQIRLESDENLVKIITVHKSKGLEFPLVFVPFAYNARVTATDKKDNLYKYHEENELNGEFEIKVDLTLDDKNFQAVERERLGEDLRKLYVALTRGIYATYVGVVAKKKFNKSALDYLINKGNILPSEEKRDELIAKLNEICAGKTEEMRVKRFNYDIREVGGVKYFDGYGENEADLGKARNAKRKLSDNWRIASYSSLKKNDTQKAAESVAETSKDDVFREYYEDELSNTSFLEESDIKAEGLHDFAMGPEAGTFLHELMELTHKTGFKRVLENEDYARELVKKHLERKPAFKQYEKSLRSWLPRFLKTRFSFGEIEFSFDALTRSLAEMEFWISANNVDTKRLDDAVCRHTLNNAVRNRLSENKINGMLKGFIDFTFEYGGRYYVADYKSNYLGKNDDAYSKEAITNSVLSHRYDMQYVLYVFALHRLLKSRLVDYDYDKHIGGAVYFFLRGINAESRGVHFEKPPRILMDELDALFR